jgi:putative transcriptional regulator
MATKFRILVEVAANQPDVQQRDIAERLELSPQAVSDYVRELVKDGWIVSEGRSKYGVTQQGVDWMLKGLRDLHDYSMVVRRAIAGVSVSAAVADSDLSQGQEVGLVMREGLLYATDSPREGARGTAVSTVKKGDDVGVSGIDGIVSLELGKVTIARIPGVQRGGSRRTDLGKVRRAVKGRHLVGAIGIEAQVVLAKAGVQPGCSYGVADAVVEAARSGISPAVVCVDDDTSALLKTLEQRGVDYEIVDGRKG